MNREDIREPHYITPIENVPSIMKHGILSHRLSAKLSHGSVAMEEIQDRRKKKKIPSTGTHIHEYANLYFDAHNPMLSRLRSMNNDICIIQVSSDVLDLPDIIITDRNAASDYAKFCDVSEGLSSLDRDRIFATYWTHPENQYAEWDHKSIKTL